MGSIGFAVEKEYSSGRARTGRLTTPHGEVETPAFVAVGTKGTVKSLTPSDIRGSGIGIVFANTFHLYLEPGDEIVRDAGGLHTFMNWDGPLMTDSGGFQIFSLGAGYEGKVSKLAGEEESGLVAHSPHGAFVRVDDDGVTFRSPVDGSEHRLSPERSIEIQRNLGADIVIAFDECTSPLAPREYQEEALARTNRWATRSLDAFERLGASKRQGLFGVIQGGRFSDLREESAKYIASLPFSGFGIGGSFSKDDLGDTLLAVTSHLPRDLPRHLLGIGEPEDILRAVRTGVDLFDCVSPTRIARTGTLYTAEGKMNIGNARYRNDFFPVDEFCTCELCRNYTRAYLAHLFRAGEILGIRLATAHNLTFITSLFKRIRDSIAGGTLDRLETEFFSRYRV